MVEAAKGKTGAHPPPRLVYAWRCDKYRTLPRSGGIDDQDYRELYLNDALPRIYDAVYAWRHSGGAKLPEEHMGVIRWLVKIGAM